MPLPQGADHGPIHHGLVCLKRPLQLGVLVLDLDSQLPALVQKVFPAVNVLPQRMGDLKGDAPLFALPGTQLDDALKVQIGQGGFSHQRILFPAGKVTAQGEFKEAPGTQPVRLSGGYRQPDLTGIVQQPTAHGRFSRTWDRVCSSKSSWWRIRRSSLSFSFRRILVSMLSRKLVAFSTS